MISMQIQCACYEKGFISCLSPCGWCKTRRVMVERAENIWARSRIFRRLRHQWLAETFASTARGLSWFLSIRYFLNDNTDNNDNGKNGRNRGMSRSDIQHRQRRLLLQQRMLSLLSSKKSGVFCLYQKLSSKKSGATWNYSRKRHPKRRNYSRKRHPKRRNYSRILAWKGKIRILHL